MATLAARANERFAWHWQALEIARRSIQIATPTDPDELLIRACQRQSSSPGEDETTLADPFWAQVWRSSEAIDVFLVRYCLQGVRVLELGCGTGAAGLAAALRGAKVTFTDGATDPLILLKMTLHRAAIDGCQVRRLIFATDVLNVPRFPLIIASDITYLRKCWEGLISTLQIHLEWEGEVLLADPYRSVTTEFIQWARTRNWKIVEHRIELVDAPVRVVRMTRSNG
jgi:predicted nicotinamide N-methyase